MVNYLMDVLENKFELPLSKKELRAKAAEDNINAVETQESGKVSALFPDLKDIDVKNKSTATIAEKAEAIEPSASATTPLPADTPKHKEGSWIKPPVADDDENPTDLPPNKTPQFQFLKSLDIDSGLSNMPSHAGNIDMMAKGTGIKNLEGDAWARAWSILDVITPPNANDPDYDWCKKGLMLNANGRAVNTLVALRDTGAFKWNGATWDSMNHPDASPGIPEFIDNELLITTHFKTTGETPVNKYNPVDDTWESYSGVLPAGVGNTRLSGVNAGVLHIATNTEILKPNSGKTGWDSILTTAANEELRGMAWKDDVLYYLTESSLGPQSGPMKFYKYPATLLKSFGEPDEFGDYPYYYSTLGYGSNSDRFYIGLWDGSSKLQVESVTSGGSASTIMSDITGASYPDQLVTSGEVFDYIAAKNKTYRIAEAGPEQIYENDDDIGNPAIFNEQMLMGSVTSIFHTEFEGTTEIQAVDTHGDSKFGL